MTIKQNHIKNIILMMITGLLVLSGCTRKINGSYILSLKEVKGHEIDSIQVTFYDSSNRTKSPTITLSSKQEDNQTFIQSFMEILKESDELSDKEKPNFSPPSESSHHIMVTFDNEFVLDLYYSIDNNWLIWSNTSNTSKEEEKKIIQYYFMLPTSSSIQKWLSDIKA